MIFPLTSSAKWTSLSSSSFLITLLTSYCSVGSCSRVMDDHRRILTGFSWELELVLYPPAVNFLNAHLWAFFTFALAHGIPRLSRARYFLCIEAPEILQTWFKYPEPVYDTRGNAQEALLKTARLTGKPGRAKVVKKVAWLWVLYFLAVKPGTMSWKDRQWIISHTAVYGAPLRLWKTIFQVCILPDFQLRVEIMSPTAQEFSPFFGTWLWIYHAGDLTQLYCLIKCYGRTYQPR